MKELTPEREDIICDLPYHDKKCEEKIGRNKRKYKAFPVNSKKLDFILKKIGRRKL
ncbi:hypothetical protein ES708_31304 [subsurface metagenome]